MGVMFTTVFVLILEQDIMMIIILALIYPPPEFNNVYIFFSFSNSLHLLSVFSAWPERICEFLPNLCFEFFVYYS
jgi:hypothetical protein